MEQGEGSSRPRRSTSGTRRSRDAGSSEAESSTRARTRRGYARRGGRAGGAPEQEEAPVLDIGPVEEGREVPLREVPRRPFPRGPPLRSDFAKDWDGRNFLLDPTSHISYRVIHGMPIGHMRTFSGYSSVMWAYRKLSPEAREILAGTAFGNLIGDWVAIDEAKPVANLVVLRAFLDRFWDTTSTFHMPGYEAGPTFGDYAVITGLPYGETPINWDVSPLPADSSVVREWIGGGLKIESGKKQGPFLIKTSLIYDYFEGEGALQLEDVGHEQNARLWLWWFLGATYLGDKGERVTTATLWHLRDLSSVGEYDWVTPSLGLTIKYCRDAVRPDRISSGSQPSLVFPGLIMEAWVFSHFPSLLPEDVVVPDTYPAVRGWACSDRKGWSWSYDGTRRLLNAMTMDKFVPRPFVGYRGVPASLPGWAYVRDPTRLYLDTPYDSFWYLGERLAFQSERWGRPIVPVDPPLYLFVQLPVPSVRRDFQEGESDSLMLFDLDYDEFACSRLASEPIYIPEDEMAEQPPDFPLEIEYEDQGRRRTLVAPAYSVTVIDSGMDSWVGRVKRVGGKVHQKLWRTANRWRELASYQAIEICQNKRTIASLTREVEELRRRSTSGPSGP